MTGSSPRTWGTPRIVGHDIDARRFIPAHVGNAYQCNGATVDAPVHPHARGERIGRTRGLTPAGGSSPRTWGTPQQSPPPPPCGTVHPHARGERARPLPPPRPVLRFIPTHVGNALPATREIGSSSVHPHARGERTAPSGHGYEYVGSSPRTWGTRSCCLDEFHILRFIPTHVGNARPPAASSRSRTVHPHARGERYP